MLLIDWLKEKKGRGAGLARDLGVSQASLSKFAAENAVPAARCPTIERLTERAVTCEELRPDVEWHVLRGVSATPLGGSDAGFAAEIPGAPRASANESNFTGAPAPEAA